MTVNTKQVERRTLRFDSLEDIEAELSVLEKAHAAGTLTHAGNYTPGQVMHHLARWVEIYEKQDFPKIPLPLKLVGRLMKGRVLKQGFPAGLPGPGGKAQPEPDMAFDEGVALLRTKLGVIRDGDFSHNNPFMGRLSHQDALKIHLRHCELHLGFLFPGTPDA